MRAGRKEGPSDKSLTAMTPSSPAAAAAAGLCATTFRIDVAFAGGFATLPLTRLPPVLSALEFDPPLPADADPRLVVDGSSVPLADMLAVPDWAEPRSRVARAVRRIAGDLGPAFVDHARYRSIAIRLTNAPHHYAGQLKVSGLALRSRRRAAQRR